MECRPLAIPGAIIRLMSDNIWDVHDAVPSGGGKLPGKKTDVRAVASLALAVFALIPCGCLFTLPMAIGSMVLAYLALENIESRPDHFKGKLLAKIGMGVGLVAIVWSVLFSFLNGWSAIMRY